MRRFASMLRSLADRLDPRPFEPPFLAQRSYKLERIEQSLILPGDAKFDVLSLYRRRMATDIIYSAERFINFDTTATPEGIKLHAVLMVGRVTHV